jgi:hypothetical protein
LFVSVPVRPAFWHSRGIYLTVILGHIPQHHLVLRNQVHCELMQFPYKYWEAILSETEAMDRDFRKQVEKYYKYVKDMSQVGIAAGSVCISAIIEIYQVNIVSYLYNQDQKQLIPYSYSSDKKHTLSIAWINARSGKMYEYNVFLTEKEWMLNITIGQLENLLIKKVLYLVISFSQSIFLIKSGHRVVQCSSLCSHSTQKLFMSV